MKKKLNLLDILFLAILIIAVAAVAFRFTAANSEKATSPVHLEMLIRVDNIRSCSVNSIQKSEAFYERDTLFGKITNVEVLPFVDNVEKMDGTLVSAEHPEKFTVLITLDVETVQNENNYFTPSLRTFGVGSGLNLESKYIAFECRVQSIQEIQ